MARLIVVSILLAFAPPGVAQDGARIARLEQEVRQLQRELSLLSQRMNQMNQRADSVPPYVAPPAPAVAPRPGAPADAPQTALPRWVNAERWRNVRTGMSELEVISELGVPTSSRGTDVDRVLLYALELGAATFVSGSVTFRNRVVTEVETPVLK